MRQILLNGAFVPLVVAVVLLFRRVATGEPDAGERAEAGRVLVPWLPVVLLGVSGVLMFAAAVLE